MYFSALNTPSAGEPDSIVHCIGVATSSNPEGPYTSGSDKPLICPIAQGGAIDASHFKDDDGSVYMTYKIDGNAIGSGGSCGNTDAPIVPTPIMLQKVAADGFTLQGPPTTILDRDSADGPLVEAPSIAKKGGQYYLFFSSNCWSSEQYDTSFAIASSIAGPYTKSGPLLVTGDNGLTSPGGADVSADGQHIIFHANFADGRTMYAADLGSVTAGSSGVKFVSK